MTQRVRRSTSAIRTAERLVLMTLALALTPGISPAAGDGHGQAAPSHKIVTIDGELVRPSALTIDREDVLEFLNYSTAPMMLVFVEPEDQADKIRCHLGGPAAAGAEKAAAQLFRWGPDRRLTEIIPPGRFVSPCSLAPGDYVFVTKKIGRDTRAPVEELGTKGTITVE